MSLMNLFRLRRTFANAFDEQQARVLYAVNTSVLFFAILGVSIVFLICSLASRYDTFRVIVLGSLIGANPSDLLAYRSGCMRIDVVLLLRRGALNAARTVFMIGVLFAAILLNFLVGENTMQSRTLLGYIVPLVAAGVLLGRSGTLIVTATVLAAILTQALAISSRHSQLSADGANACLPSVHFRHLRSLRHHALRLQRQSAQPAAD
jgi:hypothetical protein